MRKTTRSSSVFLLALMLLTHFGANAYARFGPINNTGTGSGGGAGGSGGQIINPDFGDLIVILRDKNGVPVLDDNGCIQPLDSEGNLIPLGAECDVSDETAVVEVEFGRLNVARSPLKVRQQALDEVIQAIKDCLKVSLDPAGRLVLKYRILNPDTGDREVVWKTIDAARENLALYAQLMQFGHIQTACGQIDSDRGDTTTYRPCLSPDDYPKFKSNVYHLLPISPGSTAAERLDNKDLTLASFFLAGSADKAGTLSVDVVQYLNTILGLPNATNALPEKSEFIDFTSFVYKRSSKFTGLINVLQPGDSAMVWHETSVNILDWLTWQDENDRDRWRNIKGFVQAANDSLQTILFMHNYAIPAPLWTYTVGGLSGAVYNPLE